MTELEKKLTELLNKHGICVDCGEMYCHHIDEPFASCKCGTSEWSKFTPYMELELALSTLGAENVALITDLKKVVTEATLADQEIAQTVSHITTEQMVDKVKLKVDNHVKLVAAKSWSNLEDIKGRAAAEALDGLLRRCCPVSGHVIKDENSRKTIQEYADEFKPKCNHPECK